DDIHRNRLPFPHPQDRAGSGAVVTDGGKDVRAVELDGDRRDVKGVVGSGSARCGGIQHLQTGPLLRRQARNCALREGRRSKFKKVAPVQSGASLGGISDLSKKPAAPSNGAETVQKSIALA